MTTRHGVLCLQWEHGGRRPGVNIVSPDAEDLTCSSSVGKSETCVFFDCWMVHIDSGLQATTEGRLVNARFLPTHPQVLVSSTNNRKWCVKALFRRNLSKVWTWNADSVNLSFDGSKTRTERDVVGVLQLSCVSEENRGVRSPSETFLIRFSSESFTLSCQEYIPFASLRLVSHLSWFRAASNIQICVPFKLTKCKSCLHQVRSSFRASNRDIVTATLNKLVWVHRKASLFRGYTEQNVQIKNQPHPHHWLDFEHK